MDSFIDTVDYIGIRMIQIWIKYIKREIVSTLSTSDMILSCVFYRFPICSTTDDVDVETFDQFWIK